MMTHYSFCSDIFFPPSSRNLYDETVRAVSTYAGIFNDQVYHILYPQDSS